jgi:hypothetical protein
MSQKNFRTSGTSLSDLSDSQVFQESQESQVSHRLPSSQSLSCSRVFRNPSLTGVDRRSTAGREPLLREIEDEARIAAHEFADPVVNHTLHRWQFMFSLARRLQSIPGALHLEISAFRKPLDIFLGELSVRGVDIGKCDFEQRWREFVEKWWAVKTPEGGGVLDRAYKQALSDPVELNLPVYLGEHFKILTSIAFHLSRNKEVFFLPQRKIAYLLGKDQRDISTIIKLMQRYDIITKPVNEARFTERRAAEYRLGSAFADRDSKLKVKSIEEQRAKLSAQKKTLGVG